MDSKFNRNYRIVWNASLEQWVVASELTSPGGKGKARSAVSRVAAAILVAGGMMVSAPEDASALSGTLPGCTGTAVTVSAALTGACRATAADTITVSNTGSISGSTGTAGLIHADFAQTAVTISNSGNIKASGLPAIYLDMLAPGSRITNNAGALIEANPPANRFTFEAIHVASSGLGGTGDLQAGSLINNSGSIDVYANLSRWSSSVAIAGIGGRGALAGTLNNTSTGTISATLNIAGPVVTSSSARSSLAVRGLDFNNRGISGALNNTGSISAMLNKSLSYSTSSVPSTMEAEGVHTGLLTGTLTNDGTIAASSINSGNHGASASISLTARGVNGAAGGSWASNSGTLNNSGSIAATVSNTGNVSGSSVIFRLHATGLFNGYSQAGNLINSNTGSIAATAENTGSGNSSSGNNITAIGMKVGGQNSWLFGGHLQNNGSISATATGTAPVGAPGGGNDVKAIGLQVNNLAGVVDNYGSVSAVATANNNTGTSNSMAAYGIAFGASASGKSSATNGVLNNYGTISATGTGLAGNRKQVYALASFGYWNAPSLTVNNQSGGVLKGHVNLTETGAAKANVNNAGLIDLPLIPGQSSWISGNYTQQAGGVLRIEADSLSVQTGTAPSSTTNGYAAMSVGGGANFANSGSIDVNVPPGSSLAAGQTITAVVHAGSGITAPTAGWTVTDNSGTIDFQPVVAAGWYGGASQRLNLKVVAQGAADTQRPVITRTGPAVVNVAQNSVYTDQGATATDNVDGDITGIIATGGTFVDTATLGTYSITYDVSDAAGNAASTVTRTVNVIVDTKPPVITINGANPISVVQNTTFTDPGVTAIDNVDGDISASVVTGGTFVNTSTPGTYTVTYDVTDSSGNAATQVSRTVNVTAASAGGGGAASGGGAATAAPASSNTCIGTIPSTPTGLLPMLLTMLAALGFSWRRKK